jgi:DNA-binding XRE family transcriptional regulator
MDKAALHLDGRDYVILPREEYDRLKSLARLPALPRPDAQGRMPAVEFSRASLARKIIRRRVEANLTQKRLAELAGIRVETLCRIETGKHSASVPTIDRIDRALRKITRRMSA